ncbi:GGDEF domain-containing protein [Halomonas sp. TRM85114]|uniref:GGDEF domain-containing protein n=1 Tax=Halomonas jincaotanensis TaxID=2810616 RepID=UPI001BD5412A|nr:GGDEF domain-containing protein [Halomonas jincaotanensis]MBS9402207.1 GGDEF domain-containing protein [Halomonas jincaotanensis]
MGGAPRGRELMAAGCKDTRTNSRLNWRTEFRDTDVEIAYQRSMQTHDACQMRYAMLVSAGLLLTFSVAEYHFLGFSESFLVLLAIRLLVMSACLLLSWAAWQRPALSQRTTPVNVVCLLAISGLLVTIPTRPELTGVHLASAVAASMVLYLFIPNRWHWVLINNAYMVVGFIVAMWLWSPISNGMMATSLLLLALLNLLGGLTMTQLNRLRREQFASLVAEREANHRLQAEIEERCQLEGRLRHLAATDHLTGIANRRRFFELAEHELKRAQRDKTPLALCMVDIDLFKNLNDQHGHATGDCVLASVAACCQTVLRETDIIGRYGGEEFVIALPNADLNTATDIAERLRITVAELSLPMIDPPFSLSVTVGVGCVEPGEAALDAAMLRADQALYEGKANGRNCVVVGSWLGHGRRSQHQLSSVTPHVDPTTDEVAAPIKGLADGLSPPLFGTR